MQRRDEIVAEGSSHDQSEKGHHCEPGKERSEQCSKDEASAAGSGDSSRGERGERRQAAESHGCDTAVGAAAVAEVEEFDDHTYSCWNKEHVQILRTEGASSSRELSFRPEVEVVVGSCETRERRTKIR